MPPPPEMPAWAPAALLPGLWVALLAGLLAAALRRWYDPAPAACWAVWGGLLAALYGRALLGGAVLLPLGCLAEVPPYAALWRGVRPPGNLFQGDLVLQIAPWLHLVRESFAAGRWPLWNELSGAGEPLLGNPQSQALQPLAWLALPFPVAQAAGVLAALRVLVALVFAFLLLRRLGISAGIALCGSLAFGLSGFLHHWLGWPLAGSAALLPLLLYALVLADERGARRDRALLALAAFALLQVGHPESELHAFGLAAAFGLSRLLRRPRGRRLPLLASWGLAGAVALGLAAPALLPSLPAVRQSQRAAVIAERRERIARTDPLAEWRRPGSRGESPRGMAERLLPVAAPNAWGNNRFDSYWGNRNVVNDAAGFTGTAALLGFLVALAPVAPGRRFPQERVAIAAAFVCLAVLARPPGLLHLLNPLPVLGESLTFHNRIALALNLCLAFVAACTWERWRRGETRRGVAVAAAAGLAALVAWTYLAHPNPRDPGDLAALRLGSLAVHLAALGGSALVLAAVRPGRRSARRGTAVLALLVTGELLFVHGPINPANPARFHFPEMPPIPFLRQRLAPGERMAGMGAALRANVPAVLGLADPRSTNPLKPAAYQDALDRIHRFPGRIADALAAPADPLYGLLGVRYVVAPPRRRLPPPLRLVLRRAGAWVWERPGALPRLFLPAAAEVCPGPSWSGCTAAVRDFAALAVLRPGGGAAWTAADPGGSALAALDVGSARIRARALLVEPRLLASSVYQDGGWRLLADGRRLPTTLANGPFAAAWLPPGRPALELLYRPPGFLAGMALAALAAAAALVAWAPPPALPRRAGGG